MKALVTGTAGFIGSHVAQVLLARGNEVTADLADRAVIPDTGADISDLTTNVGDRPQVAVEEGVARFVTWYRDDDRV